MRGRGYGECESSCDRLASVKARAMLRGCGECEGEGCGECEGEACGECEGEACGECELKLGFGLDLLQLAVCVLCILAQDGNDGSQVA